MENNQESIHGSLFYNIRRQCLGVWRSDVQRRCMHCKKSETFAVAQWQPERDWYLYYRTAASVYLTVWCFLAPFLDDRQHRTKFLIYLSNWNFVLMTIAANMQLFFAMKHRLNKGAVGAEHPRAIASLSDDYGEDLPLHYVLTWVLYTVTSGAALAVSFFYWVFINQGSGVSFITVHIHIVNSCYVILNTYLSAIEIRLIHGTFTIVYGLIYTSFALLYEGSGGLNAFEQDYIYWFLDLNKPFRTCFFAILGILAAIPAHCIIYITYAIRKKMADNEYNEYNELQMVPLLDERET